MALESEAASLLTLTRNTVKWVVRAAIVAALLVIPIQTLQNILIGDVTQQLRYFDQAPLVGDSATGSPVAWSWRTFIDGKLQAKLTQTVVAAMPVRAFLVRLSNELRYSVFGIANSPEYIVGAGGQLIHRDYVLRHCARNATTAARVARTLIPKLQKVQAHFRARNRVFVYLITPSKAAHMPEAFVGKMHCPNSERVQERVLPELLSQLKAAGVAAVDSASLIHRLKNRYPEVDLFPRGGVHWNALGIAHAAKALVEAINREAGRQIAPQVEWSYVVTRNPAGTDKDVLEIMNLLRPPLDYPVPEVKFRTPAPCAAWPVGSMKVAIVGNSFSSTLSQALVPGACFEHLEYFFYLSKRYLGYPPKQLPLAAENIKAISQADVVVLEQNESLFNDDDYIGRFFNEIDW
jgi:alginate O-acetyltransferase complex protein AlgJ